MHPVIVAGLVAGGLDILAAFALSAYYGGTPDRVLRGIASGVLGPQAQQGGAATAALGLGLHFVIATGAAATYFVAAKRIPMLVRHAVTCGIAYGVAVYLFMYFVVLPLSRVTQRPPRLSSIVTMIVIHMLCVGLPIALVIRRGVAAETRKGRGVARV
ncbi:MAG TPA: hypothetical protein VFS23_31500 [Vicinamibacterales bacterium]|nr:hypothetical protein [Vicinamibacterales bacterium]